MSSTVGYDFSQLYRSSALSFSPGTTFIATAHQNRIIVRSSSTLSVVRTWLCVFPSSPAASGSSSRSTDSIDQLLWSSDSLYLLAFSSKANLAWVFGLTEDGNGEGGELARIDGEGVERLVRVEWGTQAREVLAWSDYGLRLTIYSLSTGRARYIQYPKSPHNCHSYSPDGRYLAVAELRNGKDCVGIYDVPAGYSLVRHFSLQSTDIQGILWSPCGRYIAAWDSPILVSLHVHSPLGPHLTHFSPLSPTFSPSEDPGMGIRTIVWAPGGRHIALGGWDGRVRVVESEGWRCVATLGWGAKTTEKDVAVWREPSDWLRETRGRGIVQFDRVALPASLPAVRPDMTKSPPRAGISHLDFDPEATTLLVRTEQQPHVIHIHTFLPSPISHLASLIFSNPVKSVRWCPKGHKVAITTRVGAVYVWDGEGGWVEDGEEVKGGMVEGIGIPSRTFSSPAWCLVDNEEGTDFAAHDTQWSPDGSALAILDKIQFCMMYEPDAEGLSRRWDGEGLTNVSEDDEEMSFSSDTMGSNTVNT